MFPGAAKRSTPTTATRRGRRWTRRWRSIRRASTRTRCSPRSPTSTTSRRTFEAEVAEGAGHRAATTATSIASPASWPRATTGSTRRWRSRAARSRSIRATPRALGDLGMHLLRTGDEPAARTALEASFKVDPFDKLTLNLLKMMDKLDKFVTVRDGDLDPPHAERRSAGAAGVRGAARAPGAEHDVGALRVHAEGSDPHRDLPEARRLRRPDTSACPA